MSGPSWCTKSNYGPNIVRMQMDRGASPGRVCPVNRYEQSDRIRHGESPQRSGGLRLIVKRRAIQGIPFRRRVPIKYVPLIGVYGRRPRHARGSDGKVCPVHRQGLAVKDHPTAGCGSMSGLSVILRRVWDRVPSRAEAKYVRTIGSELAIESGENSESCPEC